jgi:hypothetical protein
VFSVLALEVEVLLRNRPWPLGRRDWPARGYREGEAGRQRNIEKLLPDRTGDSARRLGTALPISLHGAAISGAHQAIRKSLKAGHLPGSEGRLKP